MRFERGSLLLTSNKQVRDWPDILAGDEIRTTGILDHLLHDVVVVHIDGQSYRLRELGALLSPTREVPRGQDGCPNDPR
jgi:DNA replication protein DnaC